MPADNRRARVSADKPLITWTRFYLPRNQEWPVWSVDHDDIHAGPLIDLEGCCRLGLARMVDNPDQAAYIIEWRKPEVLRDFLSSPACNIFLNNLPEFEPAAELPKLTARLQSSDVSSQPHALKKSRFRLYKHSTNAATRELDGVVTMATFLVPGTFDEPEYQDLVRTFETTFEEFRPRNSTSLTKPGTWTKFTSIWLCMLREDGWVDEQFGPPPPPQQQPAPPRDDEVPSSTASESLAAPAPTERDDMVGRALFCSVFLWSQGFRDPQERQRQSMADTKAKESWELMAARVMPPATAWVQEHWEMRRMPRFYPPEAEDSDVE